MAVQLPSRTAGILLYHPSIHSTNDPKPPRRFHPRRVIPRRIRVRRMEEVDTQADEGLPQVLLRSRERAFSKVAVSRENAKRFFRSVIANPNATHDNNNNDNSAQPSRANPNRASWSSMTRTDSLGVNSGIMPPPQAAAPDDSLRRDARDAAPTVTGPVNGRVTTSTRSSVAPSTRSSESTTSSASSLRPIIGDPSPHLQPNPESDCAMPTLQLEEEKPVVSSNGIHVAIRLAEPVLYLQGFDTTPNANGNTAMLRGRLHIRVQKPSKIKAVTLKFKGIAATKWPEGIPPRKVDFEEVDNIMSHTWPFFNAQFDSAEKSTSADYVQLFKSECPVSAPKMDSERQSHSSSGNLDPRDSSRLAHAANRPRSSQKGDAPPSGPTVATKGYRTFLPGDYLYNFELPLDSRLSESIHVDLGSVKYELEATVERSATFRSNLVGSKEVTLIRTPAEGSLETVEPIAISRTWEDQLHYDIVISGKSFPLGTQVPIAFKLTPLGKVQCHRIRVLITENIEYFCSNKRVHRVEPTRKVQLFEKRADGPALSTFPGSTIRITAGGGVPYDQRARAARGEDVVLLDPSNLLGRLDNNANIGPTEMEFSVQLPSCAAMNERDKLTRLHFDTTYPNIQVHHWIKVRCVVHCVAMHVTLLTGQIIMRLSRPDTSNPSKRRHFEISIDSPLHILSCHATLANTSLPAYSSPSAPPPNAAPDTPLRRCGCPNPVAPNPRRFDHHLSVDPVRNLRRRSANNAPPDGAGPVYPAPAHVASSTSPTQQQPRAMHLLRAPSFNPPSFSESGDAPPLATPPPQYDSIASPTTGLADYFSRLGSTYDGDDADADAAGPDGTASTHAGGRVTVPLTPGARVNRSMEMRRTWTPVGTESAGWG